MSKKRLAENIISLALLNGINMVIPLVTLPYLVRVVGISNYGSYSIVYAMIQYGIIFSSYGFGYSTTQQISRNRDNLPLISTIFSAVIYARLIIACVCGFLMLIICQIAYDSTYVYMYILGVGMIIGDILNPTWLYQGMEKMKFMTIVNLISKSIFTLLIFVTIREETDFIYLTLMNSLGYLMAGIVSFLFALNYFKIKFRIPAASHIKEQFQNGWYIFLSTICMTLYRNSNVFILGFFTLPAMVGIYSGSEKIIKAIQSITSPISNALFPYVANSFHNQRQNRFVLIKKLSVIIGIILFAISIITYFTSPFIVRVFLDNINEDAVEIVKIMTCVIFFGGLNYILGIVGLVNMNCQREFFRYVLISGSISLILMLLFAKTFGIYSAAWTMVLTEILLTIMCVYKLHTLKKCEQ